MPPGIFQLLAVLLSPITVEIIIVWLPVCCKIMNKLICCLMPQKWKSIQSGLTNKMCSKSKINAASKSPFKMVGSSISMATEGLWANKVHCSSKKPHKVACLIFHSSSHAECHFHKVHLRWRDHPFLWQLDASVPIKFIDLVKDHIKWHGWYFTVHEM